MTPKPPSQRLAPIPGPGWARLDQPPESPLCRIMTGVTDNLGSGPIGCLHLRQIPWEKLQMHHSILADQRRANEVGMLQT